MLRGVYAARRTNLDVAPYAYHTAVEEYGSIIDEGVFAYHYAMAVVAAEGRRNGGACRNAGYELLYGGAIVAVGCRHHAEAGAQTVGARHTCQYLTVGEIVKFAAAHLFKFCLHRLVFYCLGYLFDMYQMGY